MSYTPICETLPKNLEITKDLVEGFGYSALEDYDIHDWTIEWGSTEDAIGLACFDRNVIELSNFQWERLKDKRDMVDIVLHEVAHVIAGWHKTYKWHGIHWKKVCMEIGARPQRQQDPGTLEMVPGMKKYDAYCPNCGIVDSFSRKPKHNYSCGNCSPGAYNKKYKLEIVQNW